MNGRVPAKMRWRGFAAAREGSTAVEFAMVLAPFMFMIFAILELALVFLLSTSLDTATERAARRIRTGEVQTGGETAAQFKTAVCTNMAWLAGNCEAALDIDVRKFRQFADTNLPEPVGPCPAPQTGNCLDTGALLFDSGGPTDVVVVRAYYRWPLLTPFLSQSLSKLSGNVALIMSTQTFRNEPYA